MIVIMLQLMIGYTIAKALFHLLEGHHPKDIWDVANKAGSTFQYTVVKRKKKEG